MAINIDSRVKNTKEVTIAGRNYNIDFNDKFTKEIAKVNLAADKTIKEVEKLQQEEVDKMSLEDQEKYVFAKIDGARDIMIKFFDEYLGNGQGQRIYKYFKQSTQTLGNIIGVLYQESQKSVLQEKNNSKKQFLSNKRR